ncbi:MAG: beta-hydroxyacyl-ACP dehydratase [Planctomycetota bacterium]
MRWMWIDRIVELAPRERMVAIKNVSLAEEHLHDHFEASSCRPAHPVMPGPLIIEGVAQTAGILVGHAGGFKEKVILAKVSKAELSADAVPGTTLRYTATLDRFDERGAQTTTIIELLDHGQPGSAYREIGQAELVFSHIDQNMAGTEFPEENFVFTEQFRTLLTTSGIEADF